MGVFSWIVVGLVAGVLAKFALPGDDPGGILLTIVIGMVGAIVGGYLFGLIGGPSVTGFNLTSVLIAAVGAVVLLAGYRLISRAL